MDIEYNALVTDHFHKPRNPAPGPCGRSLCGAAGSVERGTWIEFQLRMDGDMIEAAQFRAYGCPHTIALASWLTEVLPGQRLTDNFTLDRSAVREALDLPVEKGHCILVAEDAVRACAARAGEDRGD